MMLTRETDRLFLRPPIAEDMDPWIEIHEDPDVLRYLISATPSVGRVGAWRMIAMMIGHWHIRGYGQWTVIEKATSQIIGRVGLWYPEGWPDLEVGWVIRKSRWGLGFATEAAREAIDVAFDHVGAEHVISVIQPDNAPSIRVAEKLGETKERSMITDGVVSDVYGIFRPPDYRPRRSSYAGLAER
jgi:RimJ/RimL family protein N-acetyltransferase